MNTTPIKTVLALMMGALLLSVGLGMAQDVIDDTGMEIAADDGSATNTSGDLIEYVPDESTLDAAVNATESKFTVNLEEVPLDDVVKMFMKMAPDKNIIVSASNLFDKSVTVNLKDVEWQPALSSILDTHNMQLVEQAEGVFTIVERDETVITFITKPFPLHYTTVGDISPVVQSMLPTEPAGASITAFPQRNILVVRSTPDNLVQIEGLIKEIDKPSKQVAIETKFMELTDEASKQLGIKWSSLEQFGVTLGAGPFSHSENVNIGRTRNDTVSRWDNRGRVDQDQQFYDQNGAVVLQQEYVALPDSVSTLNVAPDLQNTPTRTIDDSINTGINIGSDTVESFARNISESSATIMDVDDLNLVISALQRTDGVSIISNPKIIVTSGYTNAVFRVGRNEPIIKTEITRGTTDSPGDIVTASLDTETSTDYIQGGYMRTGIELRVIPTVKTDELIEASIYPKLTRKETEKTVGNNSWPVMSVKEITTKFTLRSGQTVAIGGLTDSRDQKKVTKIPLLGDIPLIGRYLFSHTEDVMRQVETVIFVSLSLAEPKDLTEDAGIPEDAYLVYPKRIRMRAQRRSHEIEREKIREQTEAAMEAEANRLRQQLMDSEN